MNQSRWVATAIVLMIALISTSLLYAFTTETFLVIILWSLSIVSGGVAVFHWWLIIYYPLLETDSKGALILRTAILSTLTMAGFAIFAFNF